jgi:multidrug resistance protein, MATE family
MKTETPGGFRELCRIAYPLIISMGSFTLMQFVDRMFLAWYSSEALQASLPAGIVSFTLICGFMALAGYGTTLVAQYHGAGDPRACARSTAQAVWAALLSWPIMLALIPVGLFVLRTSGHPPGVIELETQYFSIVMWGSVAVPLGSAIGGFFTGQGRTLITMIATIAGNVVNLVLDYVMIFGVAGFPEMGIRGAAWASVIAGFVTPLILFVLYFSRTFNTSHSTRATFVWDGVLFRKLLRYGVPSGVHFALDIAAFAIFVLFTGRMGPVALATSNIALSVNMLAFLPLIGISIAAGTLVGQYQGRRESRIAEKSAWNAVKLGTLYMVSVSITYVLFPEFYTALFTRGNTDGLVMEDLLPIARVLMIIMGIWGVADCANIILAGALKGAGDTKFVMVYSVAMAWGMLVPGLVVVVFVLDAGVILAWAWAAFYIFLLAAGMLWRFLTGKWKTIEMVQPVLPIMPDGPGAEALMVSE